MMTTQEIANRYYELAQHGQLHQIQDELYSPAVVSIEPENNSNLPLVVEGLPALRKKEGEFFQLVEQMHGGYCHEPTVVSNFFACASGMDVTMRNQPRRLKEQLGVFEVKAGKIVKEQFFYNDFS